MLLRGRCNVSINRRRTACLLARLHELLLLEVRVELHLSDRVHNKVTLHCEAVVVCSLAYSRLLSSIQ
eukprot:COSAG06_NODE_8782_length_2072_cov_1.653827_2_plen_68_part_00